MLYTSKQMKALEKLVALPNPDAPRYEPHVWNDGVPDPFLIRILSQPHCLKILDGIIALGGDPSIPNIVKKVLLQPIKDAAEFLGTDTETVGKFKTQITPIFQTVTYSTTCYDYLANNPRIQAGEVGMPAGKALENDKPDSPEFLQEIIQNAARDNIKLFDPLDGLPPKHYLGFLFSYEQDFHFVRQDSDGFSHKAGHEHCRNYDYRGKIITSPLSADFNFETKAQFAAAFLVPSGGVKTRGLVYGSDNAL